MLLVSVPLPGLLRRGRTLLTASSRDDLISARLALLTLTCGIGSVASSPCIGVSGVVSTSTAIFSFGVASPEVDFRAIFLTVVVRVYMYICLSHLL